MISAEEVRKHHALGVSTPALKQAISTIVKKDLQPRSKWLQAFIDHGRIEPSPNYIANEINVLINRTPADGMKTEAVASVEPTDRLTREYIAKRAGWLANDRVPANYAATVSKLEAWRRALEQRTGSLLQLVHTLRGSANRTNPNSNHRPENGGTAADFQPIGVPFSSAEASRWLNAANAVATQLSVNQLLVERSDKGGIIVHVDVKEPGKKDIRITDKQGRSLPATAGSRVDTSTADYLDRVMTALFKYPVLSNISKRDVADILRIESGNVVGKPLNLRVVNSLGYAGPFQFGWRTWNEVAPRVPGARVYQSQRSYVDSVKAGEVGSPADFDASAMALAELWKSYAVAFDQLMGVGSFDKLSKIDKGVYTLHQRGPRGAMRFLKGAPITDKQSRESLSVLQQVRNEYARS